MANSTCPRKTGSSVPVRVGDPIRVEVKNTVWAGVCPSDTARLTWKEFTSRHCNRDALKDLAARPKTKQALKKLLKQVPKSVFLALPPFTLLVPSWPSPLRGQACCESICTYVYLSPALECELQPDVDFTVAHEFAHMALKHPSTTRAERRAGKAVSQEKAANVLAESWGFNDPYDKILYEKYYK